MIDWRVLVVVGPIVIAASWAAFNIASAALRQVQEFLSRES